MSGATLVDLYRRMADLTEPKCAGCRRPHACCDPTYCDMAAGLAARHGVELERQEHPTLPFMGPGGCVVPPWLRPLCTLHVCAINSAGFDPGDPEWTTEYFDLRALISDAEQKRFEGGPSD